MIRRKDSRYEKQLTKNRGQDLLPVPCRADGSRHNDIPDLYACRIRSVLAKPPNAKYNNSEKRAEARTDFPRLPRTLARRNNSPRKIPLSERSPEMTDDKYSSTRGACYIGYITQAISVNLAPLFYLIFQEKFSVTRTQIGQLVFIMFVVQLTVDVLSVYFIKKIGYRRACVISHLFAAAGLVMLSILPSVFSNAYIGILISIIVTSVGSGIIEVMISPIVNSLPNDSGRASMVLLHSFYCWGQALVVLLSTLASIFSATISGTCCPCSGRSSRSST